MKKLLFISTVVAVGFSSCKKEDMSDYVKKDEINTVDTNPKIENIDKTITPYEWSFDNISNSWEYSHYHSPIGDGVLIGFVMSTQGKQALPYYDANTRITIGLIDQTYSDEIKVTYYNGSSTLDRPTYDKYVYLKIIPSSQINPNIDLTDF